MAGFLTAAAAFVGESSIGSALVRIMVAYGLSRLINGNTSAGSGSTAVDAGVKLQANPDTTNPIPLLYGSSYFGGKVTDAQLVDSNKTMWYCLTLCEATDAHTFSTDPATGQTAAIVNKIDEIYMNNNRVVMAADGVTVDYVYNSDNIIDHNPAGLVQIYLFNNGSGTPVLPTDHVTGATVPTADARSLMPGWTTDHRMTNLTFALVKLTYNSSKNITGLPTFNFKVPNNLYRPGDAIYDYLTRSVSGAALPSEQINWASIAALNAWSEEMISYLDESDNQTKTLQRAQINGVVNPSISVFNNLQSIANASGCFINYDINGAQWGVILNKSDTPALNFNDSNILGGITVTGTSLDSMYNAIEVSYPHRELQSQLDTIRIDIPTDNPTYRSAAEPPNVLKLTLNMLDEPVQARELAFIELYQNRMDQVVTFNTDYSMIQAQAGDVITVTNSVYNWTSQQFRIIRVREIESDAGGLAVEITAQEYNSYVYTASGTPLRPGVTTSSLNIPDVGIIGIPPTATVTTANNNASPSITITGLTPSGIVDRFEFWISSDGGSTYTLLGSTTNSNGEIYAQGTALTFTDFVTPAGTYRFKTRGCNSTVDGPFSSGTADTTWAPVPTINSASAVTSSGALGSILPALGIGALAYLGYKYLYPTALNALSDSQVGQLLGMDSSAVRAAKEELDKASSPNFKIVDVAGNLLLAANKDTLSLSAGEGITIDGNQSTNDITITATGSGSGGSTAFNEITIGTDHLRASNSQNITLTHGTGIAITSDTESNTITISADATATEESHDYNAGGAIDFGHASNVYKMDDCEYKVYLPRKLLRTAGTYTILGRCITGGGYYYSDCYSYNMPTLIIPGLNATVATGHPMTAGNFTPNYKYSYLSGKTILWRVVGRNEVIAYCNFTDAGDSIAVQDYCNTATGMRPVFSTFEFPAGYRFVTFANIQNWITATMNGYPIEPNITETLFSDEYYAQDVQYTNHSRYCQNADGSEPSLALA